MRDGDSDGGDDDRREESEEQARASVFVGGGDMGALMRSIDWSTTPLGPVRAWPQSLRTSVSICLDSRFPILLWWGAELVMLYNDGYRAILGAKHPSAMGQRGKACWPEIWNIIGPMLEGVLRHGVATWSENQMLPLFRHGFDEECFFTFSYSPIRDRGRVAGVFCAVTETTDTVVGERRLRTLGDLAARTAGAVDAADVYRRAGAVLAENPHDIPVARLGIDAGVDAQASSSPELRVVDAAAVGLAPGDAGVTRAAVVPIGKEGTADVECLCAFGLHPRRTWDADYRRFLELVAEQIRAAVARARAWQAEQERAASLAALDRARTAFFSNVSHELRTPLTLILGPTESAVTSEGTARALIGEDLLVVRRNARRMLKLVNTLLEYSRIEAGRASVLFRPVDVGALTTDVASAFRSTVERAGLRLDVRAAPLDEQPFLDVDRWETIVLNLVSNAFKNTFAGAITVEIRSAPHGFELVVEDTGIGIPLEDQARIFERFHRVEGARSRTHEGTGIGLSLVQELVRLHGGSIRVDSVPGRGTRFTVTAPLGSAHLPRDRVVAAVAPSAPPSSSSAPPMTPLYVEEAAGWLANGAAGDDGGADADDAGEGAGVAVGAGAGAHVVIAGEDVGAARPHVVIADDNADMRAYLARLLAERFTVETVSDGAQALAAVRRRRPDVLVCDVMMPVMDGMALLRAVRADAELARLPVVLVSARAGEEARVESLAAGADDHVTKPFSARELVARVTARAEVARLERVVEAERLRLRSVFAGAPAAIAVLRGPEHVFELANDHYLTLVGRRPMIGKPVRAALPEIEAQGFVKLLDDVYRTGQAQHGHEARVLLDNPRGGAAALEEKFVDFTYQPTRDARGNIDGIVMFAFDVTVLVRAKRQLQDAALRKDEFLAMLAHELRNPLAPIKMSAHLVRRHVHAGSAVARHLDIIERQTDNLTRIVEDLLDVSRITRGVIQLRREPTSIADVLERATSAAAPAMRQKRHTLAFEISGDELFVDGDAVRLEQIFVNLLANAAKYTDENGRIEVAARREGDSAVVTVTDNGAGIDAETLPRIFDLFEQATRTLDRSQGGLGIGLTVVHQLVALHGGTVSVTSAGLRCGSTFTVRLPLKDGGAPDDKSPDRRGRASATGESGLRIVVVDDNVDAAQTLADLLELWGHTVSTAHDGRSALALSSDTSPDVVLLDIGLPLMSGDEVARALRPRSRAFLVAVTGYGQDADRQRSIDAGFDAHIVKPATPEQLAAVLAAARAHHRAAAGAAAE